MATSERSADSRPEDEPTAWAVLSADGALDCVEYRQSNADTIARRLNRGEPKRPRVVVPLYLHQDARVRSLESQLEDARRLNIDYGVAGLEMARDFKAKIAALESQLEEARPDRANTGDLMPGELYHAVSLAWSLDQAFQSVAKRYGVRLEGIEDDANEHSDFWQQVAAEVIAANPDHAPTEPSE